jgi:hypothetical protein
MILSSHQNPTLMFAILMVLFSKLRLANYACSHTLLRVGLKSSDERAILLLIASGLEHFRPVSAE